jgi:hypothetical protein
MAIETGNFKLEGEGVVPYHQCLISNIFGRISPAQGGLREYGSREKKCGN